VTTLGILFDYSGTLFRLENESSWLDGVSEDPEFDLAGKAELMRRLTAPVMRPEDLPPALRELWDRRDLDPSAHREVYQTMIRESGGRVPGLAERLYERLIDPVNWNPYPDTLPTLQALAEAGIAVAVVSNIAWDIRKSLARHGAADLVDEVVMSYQEGVIKPDPEIFRIACERIGVEPEHALMIGDSEEADGGAAAIGCQVAIVEPLPTAQRPDALLGALTERGVLPGSR
jgi:HAD superfamily hydrolase (TIGR01509 family)